MIFVFERRQKVRIRASSEEFAQHVAESDDALWDVGEISLIDKVEDDDAQA